MKTYNYAVLDANLRGNDGTCRPISVHATAVAAVAAAGRYQRQPGYSDARAVEWGAARTARENPDALAAAKGAK